jgi:MerR family redox-sensitive transcriptional activator SoxR
MTNLSIGEVAARAGIRPSAIRYYESIGVLPEPRRIGGQRRYEPAVLTRLAVVRMAQEAGFTVAEIVTLFHGFEPGTAASDRWRALAERKVAEIEAQIARAETMRRVLGESLRCNCLTLDECGVTGWESAATEPYGEVS